MDAGAAGGAGAADEKGGIVKTVELYPGIHIDVPAAPWNARDRAAWYWPEPMKCSEWCEKYRYLTKGALPGPWRNDNAPYLRGILDLANKRGVEWLAIKKAVQIGVSEACRGLLAFWAHQDPYPCGLALPNEAKGRQIVAKDVTPVFTKEFRRHPELAALISSRAHMITKEEINLTNNFCIYLMWSGSATSMASNPMKRAISDEVNKFEPWAANDADPVSLIQNRLTTFPESIHVLVSTPTNAGEGISQHFEDCNIHGYFLVPCVHCGEYQRLLFGEGGDYGVKWNDEVRGLAKQGRFTDAAAMVRSDPAACWYECCKCHGHISEREKRMMVRAGKWATVDDRGMLPGGKYDDLEAVKEFPPGTKIGLQIGSAYCCWEGWTLSHLAAEFLQARTMQKRFNFRTSRLGEDWEPSAETIKIEVIDDRVKEATLPEGKLPHWTARLVGVVDTQQDHFWLVIRAWGPGMRSQRIWHGKVFSFEEIEQWCRKTPWANEDQRLPAWICDKVLIDSGGTRKFDVEQSADTPMPSRVMDVYAWALKNQAWVDCIKGDARPEVGRYIRRGRGEYVNDKVKTPLPIWLLDVHHFHDELQDLMGRRESVMDAGTGEVTGEVPAWGLNTRHDPEYHHHLTNMHKVPERTGKGAELVYKWRPVRDGVRVDYRACEAYQVAGAFLTGVHQLPDMPTFLQAQEAEIAYRTQPREQPKAFTTPDGRPFLATRR